jgi:hypothetical protein
LITQDLTEKEVYHIINENKELKEANYKIIDKIQDLEKKLRIASINNMVEVNNKIT